MLDRLPTPIAIDGPAASGKSTVGQALAACFGYRFLDTGLMYRAISLAALRAGIPATDEDRCAELARTAPLRVVATADTAIFLGDEDVTAELKSAPVETAVSDYSRIAALRPPRVERQRATASEAPTAVAGRDIGTVVFPDAALKFFLDASADARSRRRGTQARQASRLGSGYALYELSPERTSLEDRFLQIIGNVSNE
jgi:cytidylate kinase